MRLYSGKIGPIVDDLVRELTAHGDIEVEEVAEVRLDLEAVLKERRAMSAGLVLEYLEQHRATIWTAPFKEVMEAVSEGLSEDAGY